MGVAGATNAKGAGSSPYIHLFLWTFVVGVVLTTMKDDGGSSSSMEGKPFPEYPTDTWNEHHALGKLSYSSSQ